jgi:transposase-like protein
MEIHPTFMDNPSLILKQDRLGRVRSTKERRASVVAEYQRSGLGAREFAQLAGIRYNTFWYWLAQEGLTVKRARRERPKAMQLVEVKLGAVAAASEMLSSQSTVIITLGGGASVALQSTAQVPVVAALIKALAPTSPC